MEVRLLGPVEAVSARGGTVALPGAKVRGVLALLALDVGKPVAPERLIDALWDRADGSGANALQLAVSKLRRALATAGERDRLVTRSAGYQLDVDPDAVDALRFEQLVRRSAEPITAESLRLALALWRGPALADAPDTDAVRALRVRIEELRRDAEEDLAACELEAGHHRASVAGLEALVAAEPLRERRWALLMQALYGSEQQAEALRAFTRARTVLVEEVGVEPGPELRRLEAAVLAQDDTAVLGASRAVTDTVGQGFRRRGHLRHPVTSLLGRADEMTRLAEAVRTGRLVTLVGPGGVGKTRLALELGRTLEPETTEGVWWVELVSARAERDVVLAVSRSLGLDDVPGGDVDEALIAIAELIGAGDAVLVLDNCEHVVEHVATVVNALLTRCPGLRVVATSRATLDVSGELVFAVEPLSVEAAMTLFDERIAGLGLPDADASLIAGICERVDRLPLGIELAAGRARHLQLAELLERLGDPLALLDDGVEAEPRARRGLRSVAAWSYELLDDAERIAFECLSVFADGATLDAAVSVCEHRGLEPSDVERLLQRLVDQSLIHVDRSGTMTRYRMLQTLYDFSRERLAASGAGEAMHRAHAEWVSNLVATVAFGERTTGRTVAVVQAEDVAIRDAVAWCTQADPALGLEITTALAPFWFGTMRVSTGWELLWSAIDAAPLVAPEDRVLALAWADLFATMAFDADAAANARREATGLAEAVSDPARVGCVALTRALAEGYEEHARDERWIVEARRAFARANHAIGLGYTDFAEGARSLVEGELAAAADLLTSAIDAFRAHGDHLGLILAVSRLGELAWRIDDLDLFVAMHAELLELGRAGRAEGVVAGATARLAMGRLAQGAIEDAEDLARAALASSGGSFMPLINGFAFRSAAVVDLALGHVSEGRRGLAAAIDAFGRGTGQVGAGYAALCWVDLSRSYEATGNDSDARHAAETAVEIASATGDPWVHAQATAQLATAANRT